MNESPMSATGTTERRRFQFRREGAPSLNPLPCGESNVRRVEREFPPHLPFFLSPSPRRSLVRGKIDICDKLGCALGKTASQSQTLPRTLPSCVCERGRERPRTTLTEPWGPAFCDVSFELRPSNYRSDICQDIVCGAAI